MQVFSKITRKRALFAAVGMLGMAALFLSCKNPFQLRKSEPPSQGVSRRVPATQPEMVLTNLKSAVAERNLENYMKCFADSVGGGKRFRFVPDPTTQIQNPGVFANWNLESERRYANYLFSQIPKDSTASLVFGLETEQTYVKQDTTVFIRDYTLNVHHTLSGDQYPRKATGRSEFHLCQVQGEWVIFYWNDRRSSDQTCWSDIKASFGK